jgi:pyruvate,water dikinase
MGVYVTSLQDITCKDVYSAGGKGANLGEMIHAGLPVPDGVVVLTRAYNEFVKENELQKKIDQITEDINADDMAGLQNASKAIFELFEHSSIPDKIVSEITSMLTQFEGNSVAVRSSATAEDLPGTSFAGQYNTYLNVGVDDVCLAVKCCWASVWNARAVSYRLNQGIPLDIPFAVVVQECINGEKSGITFTANPVNGRRDQVVINASWGLGESIVSGAVSPDQWVVNKKSGKSVETTISKKKVMTTQKDKGTELIKTPKNLQEKPVLTQKDITILNELAIKTEAYFKSPQDIEWVYKKKFYIVQTRPITSLFPLPKPLPDSEKGLRVYLSLNIAGQGMTEPLTPMGVEAFRLLYYGFSVIAWGSRARKYPDWVKTAAGRVYLDLTDLLGTKIGDNFVTSIAGKDPLTEKVLNQFLERNKDLVNKKGRLKIPLRLILLVPRLMGMSLSALVNPRKARKKMISAAEKELNYLEQTASTLHGVKERLKFIEEGAVDVMNMMVEQSTVFSMGFAALERAEALLGSWLGDTYDLEPVRQSLPYNPTTEMSMALLKISEKFKEQNIEPTIDDCEVVNFLEKFGHRAVLEIDMGLPRWREEPEYVIDILNLYMKGDPLQKIEKFENGAVKADTAIQDIADLVTQKKSRVHAWIIRHLLTCFREMGGLRERPKFDLVRSFSIFRSVLYDVGKELVSQNKLENVNDIFFVTFADIESGKNLREIAAGNKDEYKKELNRKVCPRLMTSTGESMYAGYEEVTDKGLQGVPVSPGVYEGRVRIIHHPKGAQLNPGEILVTRSTDPAWTPLFINAGALIMESGGPISHGSIVAREYGIPAVANVPEATVHLKTGQHIRVNGVSGEIILLD